MNNPDERRTETRVNKETTFFVEIYAEEINSDVDNINENGIDETKVIICNSLDISANGIQLQMDTLVPVGSILRICADIDRNKQELYLVGEVKWVAPEDDHFNIGFELYDAENTDIIGWKNQIADIL